MAMKFWEFNNCNVLIKKKPEFVFEDEEAIARKNFQDKRRFTLKSPIK